MAVYTVKSTDIKHFSLAKDDQEIGRLSYAKWFSFRAEMILNGKTYQVEPKGIWGTTIELREADNILLNFTLDWNGNIIIHSYFDKIERDFILKHKGIFKDSYILVNKDNEDLLVIKPDFKWNKFNYDYTITTTDTFDNLSFHQILVLATIHCVNYYMAMMSGTQ